MRIGLLLFCFWVSSIFNACLAGSPSYITTKDGVIVFTDSLVTGTSKAVKLEVIADNIIRVIASPGKEILAAQGYRGNFPDLQHHFDMRCK